MIDPILLLMICSAILSAGAYFYAGLAWSKMKTFERWIKILQMPTPKELDDFMTEEEDTLGSHFD